MSNIDRTPLLKDYMLLNNLKQTTNIESKNISDNKSTSTDINKQEQQDIDSETGYQKGINWDQSNNDTLDNWIKECNKQQFIYEFVLDKIIYRSKIVKIILLILCALQTTITVSNLGINNDNQTLLLCYKIIITIISTITYIITQYATIQKFDDIIKSYTSFIENIDKFLSNLVATSDIKPELRPDGDKFIIDNKNIYMRICQTNPPMEKSYWNNAMTYYTQYLNNLPNGKEDFYGQKRNAYKKNTSVNFDKTNTRSAIQFNTQSAIQSGIQPMIQSMIQSPSTQSVQPTQSAQSAQSAQPTQSAQSAQSAQPTQQTAIQITTQSNISDHIMPIRTIPNYSNTALN